MKRHIIALLNLVLLICAVQIGYAQVQVQQTSPVDMVFAIDNYTCQKCGSTKSLHCHHLTGLRQNPLESADLDNCITLCKKCHKWAHTQKGCTYLELQCQDGTLRR